MIGFQCDYAEGCHPAILQRLAQTNFEQTPGYGQDDYCSQARERLRALCGLPHAPVHFLVGGTQTNKTVISALLRPWQGVLSADTGHIAAHETGAVEATGHKVLLLPAQDGLMDPDALAAFCADYWASPIPEHMVEPGMVYISQPTELGTLYSLERLEKLSRVCRTYRLPLYVDGARLGYALASPKNNVSLPDLARLCDGFYLGGTKCGALFGEAVVLCNPALDTGFRNMIKQQGGMLAKGRLLGLQFDTLLADDLYVTICRRAVEQAMAIRQAFVNKGIPMLVDSPTNQQFPILTQAQMAALGGAYLYEPWGPAEGGFAVRFCTSWATRPEDVAALTADIAAL